MHTFAKTLSVSYAIAAAFAFGWLTAVIEFPRALIMAAFFFAPCFVAWKTFFSNKSVSRGEYSALAGATLLLSGASLFLVTQLFRNDVDKHVMFDRECRVFCRRLQSLPEYTNIDVSYSHMKGGTVHLRGKVADKDSYDRLIWFTRGLLLCQEMGASYADRVDYPGKPTKSHH
jgi:hypothetical protein